MPMADNDDQWGRPTRTFIYGRDKTKKTWWAAKAAEAGYNVILIDGDDGASIIRQLPIEARKKILVVDVVNTPDNNAFARFMATFMRGEEFWWDEKAKVSFRAANAMRPGKSYVHFNQPKLGTNDVVIIDSWTALAASTLLEWAKENDIDLTAIEKEGDQFALLNFQSRFLDYTLSKLKTFNCHIIAIGHETVYEKFGTDSMGKRKLIEQLTQPFSSTGPHAKKIGSHFSNVLRFSKLSDIAFSIDAGGDATTAGGSRQLAPKKYNWNDITPQTIFGAVGFKSTGEPCLGAEWIASGPEQVSALKSSAPKTPENVVPAQPQVLNAGEKPKTLLLKKSS